MCKEKFVALGPSEMLTLAAVIPVFHQVEEVVEMKQEVLVEMITSAASAGESRSIRQGGCWGGRELRTAPCPTERPRAGRGELAGTWAQPC